jgi:uncharacterized protein (TIGR03790 family)
MERRMNLIARTRNLKSGLLFAAAIFAGAALLRADGPGDQVIVIYNTRVPESKDIAEHYAEVRHVPAAQLLAVDLPADETITRKDFHDGLQEPVLNALKKSKLWIFGPETIPATNGHPKQTIQRVKTSKVRYAVLCYGVPLHIAEDANIHEENTDSLQPELKRNEAAVDSELACLPLFATRTRVTGPLENAFYSVTNSQLIDPTNGILIAARLDGPTATIARGLVDKAIEAENNGLWGRAYFDLRGLTNGSYKIGDDAIRAASEVCRRLGYETIIDYSSGTFPVNFPMSQIGFYAGWYDADVSGPFTRPTVEFMPGAFAYHLHSFSGVTLHGNSTRQWVGPLLAKGATATMGCVSEPYLVGTPDMAIFFHRFTYGAFSFGEAAYASQRFLSWQITVVGDPLYRPFAKGPQQLHEELEKKNSQLIEWSYLRLLNFKLVGGTPVGDVVKIMENLPITKQSAVLTEKLADLYIAQNDTSNAVTTLRQSLELKPSPEQRVRVMLELGARLAAQGRDAETYAVYQEFIAKCSDYPDQVTIYRRLFDLAQKLGKKEEAEKYQKEIARQSSPSG